MFRNPTSIIEPSISPNARRFSGFNGPFNILRLLRLIKKDISVGRYHLLGMVLIFPFILSIAISTMVTRFGGVTPEIILLIIVMLSSIYSMLFLGNDRAGREEMLLASLPVSRFNLVLFKYVSAFLMAAATLATAFLTIFVNVAVFHVSDPVLELLLTPEVILGIYGAISIILSYMLPFLIRYPAGELGLRTCILPVGLLILVQLFKQTVLLFQEIWSLDVAWIAELIDAICDWILGKGREHPLMGSALTALLAAVVSCFTAGLLFRKKEL